MSDRDRNGELSGHAKRTAASQAGAADFGARLARAREAAGLTKAQAAQLAGVPWKDYAELESGRREPRWHTIYTVIVGAGLDVSHFFPGCSGKPNSMWKEI